MTCSISYVELFNVFYFDAFCEKFIKQASSYSDKCNNLNVSEIASLKHFSYIGQKRHLKFVGYQYNRFTTILKRNNSDFVCFHKLYVMVQ